MKKLIKKNLLIPLVGFIFVVGILVSFQIALAVSNLKTDYATTTASTSPSNLSLYEGSNAVTKVISTSGIDHVDMNIQFQASTTAATLNWYYEFSDDNIDWFGEDVAQAPSDNSISHSSTTPTHTWKPDVTSVVRKNVGISTIASRFMRVIFSTSGATSTVWARFALKGETN